MAKRKVGGVVITPVKRPRRRPPGAGRLAPRRLNIRTAGFLGVERKFADFEADGDAFATTWATMQDGTIKSISAVAVGNTESTRVGRVYNITSLHMRGFMKVTQAETQSAPSVYSICRILIVHDTQTNAVELTPLDVVKAGTANIYLAFRNLQQTKRFRILMDKTVVLRPNGQATEGAVNTWGSGNNVTHFKFNRTFKKPIKVTCKGSTAVIGSIVDNSIHVIGITSDLGLTPSMSYHARIRFTG